jgi:hypothetical protein
MSNEKQEKAKPMLAALTRAVNDRGSIWRGGINFPAPSPSGALNPVELQGDIPDVKLGQILSDANFAYSGIPSERIAKALRSLRRPPKPAPEALAVFRATLGESK